MIAESIKFRGHSCFKNGWAGFDCVRPINVVIGRNNAGKSHLLDLVEHLCSQPIFKNGWQFQCTGVLEADTVRSYFGIQAGGLVNTRMSWEVDGVGNINITSSAHSIPIFQNQLVELAKRAGTRLSGRRFRRLSADRDIVAEGPMSLFAVQSDGTGATNVVRRYIVSSKLPREIVQVELLASLNEILGPDGGFAEIQIKEHEDGSMGQSPGNWEIYLGQEKKGLVALSRSGSGLKTVILVLLNLLVTPKIDERPPDNYVFAFEELENNLHPAILRRLFRYLETYATDKGAIIFLTTHSSVALDLFSVSKDAQIIHVTHDGESAKAEPVTAHFDRLDVITQLGAKPSDLLQANCIIWVEGPSDRIYINRWIDLWSNGTLREGRDYQCAFYGGALLARIQFTSPEQTDAELANLFRINPNVIVVCDSDRTSTTGEGSQIKGRVQKIKEQLENIPNALIWITEAKEIENYLLGSVLSKVFKSEPLPDPGQYETFFPQDTASQPSYAETRLKRRSLDKMELAVKATPYLTKDLIADRFELGKQIGLIVEKIRGWNA